MIDSIFSPSFGNRPSSLVGRDEILRNFKNGLASKPGSMERSVILLGQRGSGKTVLLWELCDCAKEMGFCVASPSIASEGMLDRIVEKIQDDGERFFKSKESHITGGSLGALGFSVGLQFDKTTQETKSTEYKLTHLARRLTEEGHGMLILVDELQANSSDVRRLVVTYQEMVGEGLNVALVLAGVPGAVSSTLNDKVLTFLNRANQLALPDLDPMDVSAFFTKAFKELNLKVEKNAQDKAVDATAGSPYMLQLVGHYMVAHADDDGELGEQAADQAIESAQKTFMKSVCETVLDALSEKDVEFLKAMASFGENAKTSDVAYKLDVTADYAQIYRRRLIDAGVIAPAGHGRLEFAVPYLAEYLASEER